MKNFLRKYGYYVLAFSLILIVGVTVGLTGGGENGNTPIIPDDSEQTATAPIEMLSPLSSPEVLKWYSDTELFYNATLKQWESHRGVDLTSAKTDVVSVLDGVVKSCTYDYENGYCITIEHADGLSTSYCSLKNLDSVKEGDNVKRGQKIGDIDTSASNEASDGDHLHFQVMLNGKNVDPANYLTFENK